MFLHTVSWPCWWHDRIFGGILGVVHIPVESHRLTVPENGTDQMLLSTALERWQRERRRLQHSELEVRKAATGIARIGRELGWKTIQDIRPGPVRAWLGEQLEAGKSPKTHNNLADRLRSFTGFCASEHWLPCNVLEEVKLISGDVTGEGSRPLSTVELRALVQATMQQCRVDGRSGRRRERLYLLAAYTGLRLGELGRVRWGHVSLQAEIPCITLPGLSQKNRKKVAIPIAPQIIELVRAMRSEAVQSDHAAAGDAVLCKVDNITLQRDFKRAGIKPDEQGQGATFHGIRKWLANELDRAGVRSRVVRAIMRHGGRNLTAERYQSAPMVEIRDALAQLPRVFPVENDNFTKKSPKALDNGGNVGDISPVAPMYSQAGGRASSDSQVAEGSNPSAPTCENLMNATTALFQAVSRWLDRRPDHDPR